MPLRPVAIVVEMRCGLGLAVGKDGALIKRFDMGPGPGPRQTLKTLVKEVL